MTANDGDGSLGGILLASELLSESLGTNDVEGGDAKEAFWVENASSLENLSGDGDGRVDGVRDDEDKSLGAMFCDALDEGVDDAGIDLEQVVAAHAGLACWGRKAVNSARAELRGVWIGLRTRNSSGDDNDISASESLLKTVVLGQVSLDGLYKIVSTSVL